MTLNPSVPEAPRSFILSGIDLRPDRETLWAARREWDDQAK